MNVEFHYYSTAFLAVKAGFPLDQATTLAYAGQYVDDHYRPLEIQTGAGTLLSSPTQNFSFWDPSTVFDVLASFHFLPAGERTGQSPRADGRHSVWDVRPDSAPAKAMLIAALRTGSLHRMGLALHTYSDTWAHQNFTARNEEWNRLDPGNRLPSPGHAQAGWSPDLWLAEWSDPRLKEPSVVNFTRFAACARKVYRYLCTFRGRGFEDEADVAAELAALVSAGQGRESVEDRAIEFVLALNLEPYDKKLWTRRALEPFEDPLPWPALERWKKVGEHLLDRTGLSRPLAVKAKPGFEATDLAAWIKAADEHRAAARELIKEATGGHP